LLETKILYQHHFSECYNLLKKSHNDLKYFNQLGWSKDQFLFQLSKDSNLALILLNNGQIEGFIIGDLITIEKKSEYEILVLYVDINARKLGHATKLINDIPFFLSKSKLKNIFLEVDKNNKAAINLYLKNYFIKIGVRQKYYNLYNNKVDAYLFKKIIND